MLLAKELVERLELGAFGGSEDHTPCFHVVVFPSTFGKYVNPKLTSFFFWGGEGFKAPARRPFLGSQRPFEEVLNCTKPPKNHLRSFSCFAFRVIFSSVLQWF